MTNDCCLSLSSLSPGHMQAEPGPKMRMTKRMMKRMMRNFRGLLSLWWLFARKLAVPVPKKKKTRHYYYSKAI